MSLLTLPVFAQGDALQTRLSDEISDDEPGMVVLVDLAGEIYTAAAGSANLDTATPLATDDLFRIGSVSKMFTGLLAAMLAAEGMLDLNAPITTYLDSSITDQVPFADQITTQMLLNHSSGVFSYTDSDVYADDLDIGAAPDWWTAADTIPYLTDEEPYFSPGEGWAYSNSNFTLAELILQVVSGQSLADLIDTRIAQPFNAPNFFQETATRDLGDVRGYDGDFFDITADNGGFGLGDGGIIADLESLRRVFAAIFRGDRLSDEVMAHWLETVDTYGDGETYALGVSVYAYENEPLIGHAGATGGFQSQAWYVASDDAIVILLSNNFDSDLVTEDFAIELFELVWDNS